MTTMFFDFGDKILSAFLDVEITVQTLCRHVLFDLKELPAWGYHYGSEELIEDKGRVLHALKQFGYTSTQSAQETLHCPGAVACGKETLELVAGVNQAKLAFKAIVAECRRELNKEAIPFVHATLRRAGFQGIRLRQVTRSIHAINYHPRRIAWSCVKHSSNRIRTPIEIEEDLLAVGQGDNIEIQLEKLKFLPPKEKLVIHKEIHGVWQFNISSFKQEGISSFQGGRSSLPLFYVHNPSFPTPIVCLSQQSELLIRKQRSDKMIEDQVFLPSVNAHRQRKKVTLNIASQ